MVFQSAIRRWIGDSSETKPLPDFPGADGITPTAQDVPAWSEFYETDTKKTYVFDGDEWVLRDSIDAVTTAIEELLVEIRDGNELHADMRLELMAVRLAVQERMNEGNATQHDFRQMAKEIIDRIETEEP